MKIAVTAAGPDLDGPLDPRFGRCPYFLIVETDDMTFEAVENPNIMLGGGAGIQSAQLMSEKGVKFVLTGNCGPNAYQTLSSSGIEVVVGCSGRVQDAVEQFKIGRLSAADRPNVASHFGTGNTAPDSTASSSQQFPMPQPGQQDPTTGRGMGRGRGGMGRGMGGGMGRGMGGGMGRGMGRGDGIGRGMGRGNVGSGNYTPAPTSIPMSEPPASMREEEELKTLKQQAEAMSRQMQGIQERIRQLEKGKED